MVTHLIRPDALVLEHTIAVGAAMLVEDGVIRAIGAPADLRADRETRVAGTLLPGLVDLHVNGAGGRSVHEATPEALDAVAAAVLAGGASAFLPTLISAPLPLLVERTRAVARWIRSRRGNGAVPLGIHLEGPFLESPGAHDARHLVDPSAAGVQALLDAAEGTLKLVTLAPSRKGAADATRMLRARGVTVSLGHAESPAGFAECVAAGASMVTHLFNVMGTMHHREPGIAGLALDDARVSASLIADGAHVTPAMLRLAFACLSVDRTILVSDAVAAAGMRDGDYDLSGIRVRASGGVVRDAAGRLAGSALTMERAVRNFAGFVPGVTAWTLARIAARNPARAIGATDHGVIAVGKPAPATLLAID